jgi:hypothetical protein
MLNLEKRLSLATIVSIVAPFALLLCCSRAFAQSALRPFSANETRIVATKTTTRKIYVTDHAVRIETNGNENGQGSIAIVRLDLNQIDILSPARNTNIETPYAGEAGTANAEFASYLIGAEVQRESLGSDQVGQYRCEKSRVKVTYKGRVYVSREWAATEMNGFVVKRQGVDGEWSSELSNIQFGPQEPSLFAVPSGFITRKYSKNWTTVVQQMTAAHGTQNQIAIARAVGLDVSGDDPNVSNSGASNPPTDHYSFQAADPVTQEIVFEATTNVDFFPSSKSKSPSHPPQESTSYPFEPKVLNVGKRESGSDYVLKVTFVVPNDPKTAYDLITIYGTQFIGANRSHDHGYPSIRGHWQPNDQVTFAVQVPKEFTDPSKGWDLTFCVGSDASCYPSANLLTLISETSR